MTKAITLLVLAMLCLGVSTTPALADGAYGLDSLQTIGNYFNSNLPPTFSQTSGGWITVPAFPNLTFEDPTFLLGEPGTNRLYVCGRQGTVWFFNNDSNVTTKTVFLSLTNQTQGYDDCGLLGMAFHPEYGQPGSTNRGYFYVYYQYTPTPTNPLPNRPVWTTPTYNRLSRFTVPDGSLVADPASELVLVNQFDQHLWHNGGSMFFGNDGFLYWTDGDEGGEGDSYHVAQMITNGLFSGVFRVDVNQDPAKSHPIIRQPLSGAAPPPGWPASYTSNYFIPNDNPFVNANGTVLEEFFALGFRSPHRMSQDPLTQNIWLGDVGDSTREEVDLITSGGNYQWAYMEGYMFPGPEARPDTIIGVESPPIYDYPHSDGNSCIIGGYVYRGSLYATNLGGQYIFGDNYSGRIWSMAYDGTNTPVVTYLCNMPPGLAYNGLSSFGLDQSNEVYMCQMGTNTQILKIVPAPPSQPPPTLLSQIGIFTNLATLAPNPGLIPYNVNSPLWSDGAVKTRYMAVPNVNGSPNAAINFYPTGEWNFPGGTVFVKHFELPTNDANPTLTRRLETRVLVCTTNSTVYGLTYKWRDDYSDADLLTNSLTEPITIATVGGGTRTQMWYYPSQQDCLTCHNQTANYILGVKTRQLNGNFTYPGTGVTDNQLRTLNHLGVFYPILDETNIPTYESLVNVTNTSASLDDRMRSYLDSNCSQCHRPGNAVEANWIALYETPLAQQNIIGGVLANNLGNTNARVIAPSSIANSMMYLRMDTVGTNQMPPLARNAIDTNAVNTLVAWINSYVPPSITSQPSNQTVIVSNSVSFSVAAAGTGPFNYQWQFFSANIAGATNSSFAIADTQVTNAGSYSVLVSSFTGSVDSSNATLTVDGPPVIAVQPQNVTTNLGAGVTFSVTAGGTAPLYYQWQLNGATIPGATNSAYLLSDVQMANDGNFSVVVSNIVSVIQSSNATLVVTLPSPTNLYSADIGSVLVAGSSSLSNGVYTISASGDDIWNNADAFHYVYVPVDGDSSVVARVASIQPTDPHAKAGVMIRESLDPASTEVMMLISSSSGGSFQYRSTTGGNSSAQDGPDSAAAPYWVKLTRQGSAFTGYASADGTNWQLIGTTTVSMTNNVYLGMAVCAHFNGLLNTSTLDNFQFINGLLVQPLSQSNALGSTAAFSASFFGTPLTYQWEFNGANISGATNSSYALPNAQSTNAGAYSVVATNLAGSATSSNAILTLGNGPVLGVISNKTVYAGLTNQYYFNISNSDTNTLAYSLGAGAPAGATITSIHNFGEFLWIPSASQLGSNNITVSVVDTNGYSSSRSFTINVISGPVILSAIPTGTNVTVVWSSIPGSQYQLQYLNQPGPGPWSTVAGNVTASGFTSAKTNSIGTNSQRFYRVQVVPPPILSPPH